MTTKRRTALLVAGGVAIAAGVYLYGKRKGTADATVPYQPLYASTGGVNPYSPGGSLALPGGNGSGTSPTPDSSGGSTTTTGVPFPGANSDGTIPTPADGTYWTRPYTTPTTQPFAGQRPRDP